VGPCSPCGPCLTPHSAVTEIEIVLETEIAIMSNTKNIVRSDISCHLMRLLSINVECVRLDLALPLANSFSSSDSFSFRISDIYFVNLKKGLQTW